MFCRIFSLLSTIPNFLHVFSVHLMNCYFSDFWYSHVTEKRTLRREKCNMRKKQDIMWEQSTLWESMEKWVTKYLKKNHSEYCERQVKAMRIVLKNSIMKKELGKWDCHQIIRWKNKRNWKTNHQKRALEKKTMPYFNFSISFGVQSKNSQSFASIVKSILLTLFLQ